MRTSMRRSSGRSMRVAVHVNIIYQHVLWIGRGRVRVARPVASNRHVEQQKERVVVNPLRPFGQVRGSAGAVEVIVYVEADRFRLPLDGIDVEVVGKALAGGHAEGISNAFIT